MGAGVSHHLHLRLLTQWIRSKQNYPSAGHSFTPPPHTPPVAASLVSSQSHSCCKWFHIFNEEGVIGTCSRHIFRWNRNVSLRHSPGSCTCTYATPLEECSTPSSCVHRWCFMSSLSIISYLLAGHHHLSPSSDWPTSAPSRRGWRLLLRCGWTGESRARKNWLIAEAPDIPLSGRCAPLPSLEDTSVNSLILLPIPSRTLPTSHCLNVIANELQDTYHVHCTLITSFC